MLGAVLGADGRPGDSAFSVLTIGLERQARCTPACDASQKAVSGTCISAKYGESAVRVQRGEQLLPTSFSSAGLGRMGKIWTGRTWGEGGERGRGISRSRS